MKLSTEADLRNNSSLSLLVRAAITQWILYYHSVKGSFDIPGSSDDIFIYSKTFCRQSPNSNTTFLTHFYHMLRLCVTDFCGRLILLIQQLTISKDSHQCVFLSKIISALFIIFKHLPRIKQWYEICSIDISLGKCEASVAVI